MCAYAKDAMHYLPTCLGCIPYILNKYQLKVKKKITFAYFDLFCEF